MILLVGGLLVGYAMGDKNWRAVAPFFDTQGAAFKGALVIFLLEMGVVAGSRLADLAKAGPFLLVVRDDHAGACTARSVPLGQLCGARRRRCDGAGCHGRERIVHRGAAGQCA